MDGRRPSTWHQMTGHRPIRKCTFYAQTNMRAGKARLGFSQVTQRHRASMATFAATSAACSVASSASPLMAGGAKFPSPSAPRGASAITPSLSVRAAIASEPSPSSAERNSRRAFFFGAAFASAIALSSLVTDRDNALAAEEKKKKNKCPTLCVQTPTASCCYGYGN